MRALICPILIIVILTISPGQSSASNEPAVLAPSAILIDVKSGQILYAKNAHERRPPASTTKIMTGIMAIEGGCLNDQVTVSKNAAKVGEASIYLRLGEKLSLEELVQGTLIQSGNDAAVALAEYLAGNQQMFLTLANRKANIIGAINTNFRNPHGLPAQGHYSTAYDLSLIARYALQNATFARIVKMKETTISWEGSRWKRYLRNTNRLLWRYPGADGVKTGTTNAAGKCLVASATKNGQRLIAVVLKSPDRYGDASRLLDYGFNNFETYQYPAGTAIGNLFVANGIPHRVPVITGAPISITIFNNQVDRVEKLALIFREAPDIPLAKGTPVGFYRVLYNGKMIAQVPLLTGREVRGLNTGEKLQRLKLFYLP